jgi:hypothetical protein
VIQARRRRRRSGFRDREGGGFFIMATTAAVEDFSTGVCLSRLTPQAFPITHRRRRPRDRSKLIDPCDDGWKFALACVHACLDD